MFRPTYLLLFTVLSYLLLSNSSQQFFVFRLIMLVWKTVKEQKSRMIGWTVKMPWLSQQSHLVWELTKDQSDLLFIGVLHRVLQVINFHMAMWTRGFPSLDGQPLMWTTYIQCINWWACKIVEWLSHSNFQNLWNEVINISYWLWQVIRLETFIGLI